MVTGQPDCWISVNYALKTALSAFVFIIIFLHDSGQTETIFYIMSERDRVTNMRIK